MDELVKGNEVYGVLFTKKKPLVENAATITGRQLARYLVDDTIEWFASGEEGDDDHQG